MKKLYIACGIFLFAGIANAQTTQEHIQAFRSYKEVAIELPTSEVVHVPFDQSELERPVFAVHDIQEDVFVAHQTMVITPTTPVSIQTTPRISGVSRMTDRNISTSAAFELPRIGDGVAHIRIETARPITTSSLVLTRDNYVALPKYITISARTNGTESILLKNHEMKSEHIRFPKTTAQEWVIDIVYTQPLRISELAFVEEGDTQTHAYGVRFVVQPNHLYRVYADPDRHIKRDAAEVGNLRSLQNVRTVNAALQSNPQYTPADVDEDGIPDANDNCVQVANKDQVDANANDRGDACDDTDQDGVINAEDNCPDHANRNQRDEDGDGVGDVCDGVESRLTEQYPWLPWLGLGFAAAVLAIMFAQAAQVARKK